MDTSYSILYGKFYTRSPKRRFNHLYFADITRNDAVRARLAAVYASPDDVDLWVGALAEDPLPGSHLGELNHLVVSRQFEILRDGDRFWYERAVSPRDRDMIAGTTLAEVIRRNTTIRGEISDDVFRAGGPPPGPGPRPGPR